MDTKRTHTAPYFSIIIPACNRPRQIAECLEAISRQDCPYHRFEVVVVDDGSASPLAPVVEPFRDRLRLCLLVQENQGPAAARNHGAAAAHGEYLVFTDDDCRPAPGWLAALEQHFQSHPTTPHAVTGKTVNGLPDNFCSTASQELIDYLYAYFNGDDCRARFLTSNNLALPADCFRKVGGFDTTYRQAAGEDRDFTERLLETGLEIRYDENIVLFHAHPLTFASFVRQHFNYGRAAYHFQKGRARRRKTPITFEPLSFYLSLLRHPFSYARPWGLSAAVACLLAVTQLVNAAGFAWQSVRCRPATSTLHKKTNG